MLQSRLKSVKKTCQEFGVSCSLLDEKGQVLLAIDQPKTTKFQIHLSNFGKSRILKNEHHVFAKTKIGSSEYLIIAIENVDESCIKVANLLSVIIENGCDSEKMKLSVNDLLKMLIVEDEIEINELEKMLKELKLDQMNRFLILYVKYPKKPRIKIEQLLTKLLPPNVFVGDVKVEELEEVAFLALSNDVTKDDIREYSKGLSQIYETEYNIKLKIGVSSEFQSLEFSKEQMKKAYTAIHFNPGSRSGVFHYDDLGLGKLLFAMPDQLKRNFLNEVFKNNEVSLLDKELLNTAETLFLNNLNISETARQLYIHRNTLVYRIDKIKKMTDIDITNFDDASLLRAALLIITSLKDEME